MKYIDKPFYERTLLMVVDDDRGTANDAIDVFRIGELPQGIHFNSKLAKNELYIAHPAQKGLYIPYSQHDLAFFQDKIHELAYLLQSLGAVEISISWVKGKTIEDCEKSSFNINGSASVGKYGTASGSYASMDAKRQKDYNGKKIMLKITNDPVEKPYVPHNLYWYKVEQTWARMAQQRLNGMTSYSLQVSSNSTNETQSYNAESVKAALRVLFVKLNVETHESIEKMFRSEEETVWQVDVKFKPLSAFANYPQMQGYNNVGQCNTSSNHINGKTEDTKEIYRKSCQKLIKSNRISEPIAIELNRIRDKLNVPVEDAEQIELEIRSHFKMPWYKRLFK